jgi:Cu/Ag efflux pump CusA
VLLFLRDWRSALIVVMNIAFALLVVMWWLTGQSLNIMTRGGLALAVGGLVHEATVELANIHTRLRPEVPWARTVVEACKLHSGGAITLNVLHAAVLAPSLSG